MAKRLLSLTWEDVQNEMSIAGNPEKITQLCKEIHQLIADRIDKNNIPDFINVQFGLDRIKAEMKLMEKHLRIKQSIKPKS